jgi:hypothetical protein
MQQEAGFWKIERRVFPHDPDERLVSFAQGLKRCFTNRWLG